MPELPEVETIRRQLEPRLVGRTITEADSHWSDKFTPAVAAIGHSILSCSRRGKFLLVGLDNEQDLIIHLGMTGVLRIVDTTMPGSDGQQSLDNPYLRAWWLLDDETRLEFTDVRRFGRIRITDRGDFSQIPTLRNAGPEPFDPELTNAVFWGNLKKSRRAIKTQLLSQRPIAGVGNIYADEALWIAEINPKATRVGKERAARLLEAIRHVLEQGIVNGGTTLRDYRNIDGGTGDNQHILAAYGRGGEPCLRCNKKLHSESIDARTTTWCLRCQKQ